jgi:hypothetical protein
MFKPHGLTKGSSSLGNHCHALDLSCLHAPASPPDPRPVTRQYLTGMTRLKTLDIFSARVSDAGLLHVARLPSLTGRGRGIRHHAATDPRKNAWR